MNDDVFNLELRKFLKRFGITAQREIEHAVAAALAAKKIAGDETLKAHAVLSIDGLGTISTIDGAIALQ